MNLILRFLSVFALISGMALAGGNALPTLNAALIEQNATHPAASSQLTMDPIASAYQPASAAEELTIGVLLIVLGFFLHALIKSRESRRVHISVVPRKEKTIRPKELYWMEMKM